MVIYRFLMNFMQTHSLYVRNKTFEKPSYAQQMQINCNVQTLIILKPGF